ncbi:MAG TPA: hypothetical protein VN753_09020 [Terracidiphilus sp.]|jgi:hypothetical protein|nr:hypothetical protein [Terracidiphilus sp.]
MSNNEIAAAWVRARQRLREIEAELMGLEFQLRRTGESLKAAGQVFLKTPDAAWKLDTRLLSDAVLRAEEDAKRYKQLLAERVEKQAEIGKLNLSA